MAVRFPATVPFMVGKGSIPQEYRQHAVKLAQRHIKALLKELDAHGKPVWTEKTIGEQCGLSQATINELKNGGGAKMGLRILLGLRDLLMTPLDELLGLPPLRINRKKSGVTGVPTVDDEQKRAIGTHSVATALTQGTEDRVRDTHKGR